MNAVDALYALSFVFLVVFLAYVTLIAVPFLRRRSAPEGSAEDFQWHVFIPCRDEDAVIGATLAALRADFPGMHVWVVDDASDDDTAQTVAQAAATDPCIHLVSRRLPSARTGKGDALNAAYQALTRWLPPDADRASTIVVVIDADGRLAENALRQVAGPTAFADPRTGAVQVAVRMSNRDQRRPVAGGRRVAQWWGRYLVRMQDIEFCTTIAAMQCLRLHTLSVGLGGNGQFTRLSALDAAAAAEGQPWGSALLEDYELGLRVILAGYLNVYAHDTHVDQEALPSARRLLAQRTRWCQGGMQCARYLPKIYAAGTFTNAGAVEAAYFLMMPFLQLVGVVLWPSVFIAMLTQGAMSPGGLLVWAQQAAWIVPLCFLTGIFPFLMWPLVYCRRDERHSLARAVGWGFGYWLYMYQSYICVVRAFARLVTRRSGWVKTRRNAERVLSPVAQT